MIKVKLLGRKNNIYENVTFEIEEDILERCYYVNSPKLGGQRLGRAWGNSIEGKKSRMVSTSYTTSKYDDSILEQVKEDVKVATKYLRNLKDIEWKKTTLYFD